MPSARNPISRAGRCILTDWLCPQRWSATALLGHPVKNVMHLLASAYPRYQQPSDSSRVPELPPATEISSLRGKRRHPKSPVHQWPATVHSRSVGVHERKRIVHHPFAFRPPAPGQISAVSPLRESVPFRGRKRRRRGSIARRRGRPRAPRESNSRTRRWETGLGRRRNTGRGPHISTFPDEPSRGFLSRRPGSALYGSTKWPGWHFAVRYSG